MANDQSYKFWEISREDAVVHVRFGRIGNQGQSKEITHPNVEEAKRDYESRIDEKIRRGYKEKFQVAKKVITNEDIWRSLEDHEPFLKSILEDPDEPGRYAIYADWLMDRNDPRGTFTQLQLEQQDPQLPLYRRGKIDAEIQRLRALHSRQWLGSLANWLMDRGLMSIPYKFFNGQLSSLYCETLDVEFAAQLRDSPYCRMLRELTVIEDGIQEGVTAKHGLETLLGADFSNLRDLRVGTEDHVPFGRRGQIHGALKVVDLIATMPRLQSLILCADVRWSDLFAMEFQFLTALYVDLRSDQLAMLAESGIVKQLHTLGLFGSIDDEDAEFLASIEGYEGLVECLVPESRGLTQKGVRRLEVGGVSVHRVPGT